MTQEITGSKKAPAVPASEDLSRAIEQSVERKPDEMVKSVRVFNDCYRCNWWVLDVAAQPTWLSSGKIRKSQLLRVTRSNDGLLMEEVGKQG